eukprot:299059-Pleurochrysis_carterae.AAC.1
MRAAKPAVLEKPRSTLQTHTHVALYARARAFVSRRNDALGFVVSLCVARCVHTPVLPRSALVTPPRALVPVAHLSAVAP